MIEFKKCPVIDGVAYPDMDTAKRHAIQKLLLEATKLGQLDKDNVIVTEIVRHGPEIVDILTTTESSKPSARKINGGTKKRKGTVTPPAQTP